MGLVPPNCPAVNNSQDGQLCVMCILPQLEVKGRVEGGRGREREEHEAKTKGREKGGGVLGSVRSSRCWRGLGGGDSGKDLTMKGEILRSRSRRLPKVFQINKREKSW